MLLIAVAATCQAQSGQNKVYWNVISPIPPRKIDTILVVATKPCCNDTAVDRRMKPYISVGAGVGGRTLSYSAETGYYNSGWWVAILWELDRDALGHLTQVYVGPKIYRKLYDVSDNSQLFLFGDMKANLRYHDLIFEPGLAYVFLNGAKWAGQFSMSSPLYEGQKIGEPMNLSVGVSLNYWIK